MNHIIENWKERYRAEPRTMEAEEVLNYITALEEVVEASEIMYEFYIRDAIGIGLDKAFCEALAKLKEYQ